MAKDPYRYFRIEARELLEGISGCALELERNPGERAAIARLLRHAHTLKGAARVVRLPDVAELAHAVEEALAPWREAGDVPRGTAGTLLALADGISARLSALDAGGAPAPAASAPADTLRLEIADLDGLVHATAQAAARVSSAQAEMEGLREGRRLGDELAAALRDGGTSDALALVAALQRSLATAERHLGGALDELGRDVARLAERAHDARLVPAASMFPVLERAVHDAAATVGRRVEFGADGAGARLDAHIALALRDAMLHVVRNAVAHGIESDAERASRGKTSPGRVEVRIAREGSRVRVSCRDDGRGIDPIAVRAAAARRGWIGAADDLDPPGAIRLLLRGGLSTAREVTELSGRGIGMDVVGATARALRGDVALRSEPGRGTTVEIVVPVSLSSVAALLVRAGEVTAAIPVDAVRRVAVAEDVSVRGRRATAHVGGAAFPFASLARLVGRTGAHAGRWPVVLLQSRTGEVAVGVDAVLGVGAVVTQAVPVAAGIDELVSGVSIDGTATPRLVLHPDALARAVAGASAEAEPRPARLPILVVDDSLTTRMLQRSILEAAGFEVALAGSAEEGLDMARTRRFGIFLVDVEMPGMDGFAFVARTREDPALRGVPSILVTSRSSAEDRRRGREAGAVGYMVKSEFDQRALLALIEKATA